MSEEYSKNYELIDENTAWNGNDVIPPDDIPEDAESVDTVDAMLKRQKLEKVNSRIDSIKKEIGRFAKPWIKTTITIITGPTPTYLVK